VRRATVKKLLEAVLPIGLVAEKYRLLIVLARTLPEVVPGLIRTDGFLNEVGESFHAGTFEQKAVCLNLIATLVIESTEFAESDFVFGLVEQVAEFMSCDSVEVVKAALRLFVTLVEREAKTGATRVAGFLRDTEFPELEMEDEEIRRLCDSVTV
jgi:hypothetical protein